MRASDFTIIHFWQHLGDNKLDLPVVAPFVGDQSAVMTFEVQSKPARSGNPVNPSSLILLEMLRNSDALPLIKVNGSNVYASVENLPPSSPAKWELWAYYTDSIVEGTNTIQILRDPTKADDFAVGNITILWPIENRARSSGWVNLGAENWQSYTGLGNADLTSPDDTELLAVSGWWPLEQSSNIDSEHSIINVYIDDGAGARQVPYRRRVAGGGKSGTVEFRYIFDTNLKYAMWLHPIAALVDGEWDISFIKNSYLPSLKWRVATVPAL